ncbi:MAG: carboxypeptidase-like regulatory domain-containing protein, partial [Sphingobacteriales bacterium]
MRKKFMFSVMALILCLNLAIAQTFQVSGKVTDENGSPLGSVSITEKGKKSGTTTDESGNFKISVSKGAVLVFSAVGFDSKEMVASSANLNLSLSSSVRGLSEVVVTGFGGAQIKKELTGNIARVRGKDIEYLPTPTIDAAL